MKIGILTQPLGDNYGGILQNWALQQAIKLHGYESITIRHTNVYINHFLYFWYKLLSYFVKKLKNNKSEISKKLPWDLRPNKLLKNFIKKYIKVTKEFYELDEKKLKKIGVSKIIVGSDQVWRPRFNPERIGFMFCDFLDISSQINCFAFSASFGTSDWEFSEVESKLVKEEIKKFKYVSVREETGLQLCSQFLKMGATETLDPTMLLDTSYYRNLIIDLNIAEYQNKLGIYILDLKSKENDLIDVVRKKMCKEVISLNRIKNGNKPSVQEWLYAINSSSFIITDSFHGTVFSILFNKPFISIVNHIRGKDRFTSILKKFELEERMIEMNQKETAEALVEKAIDWNKVNKILQIEKEKSLYFLKKILEY